MVNNENLQYENNPYRGKNIYQNLNIGMNPNDPSLNINSNNFDNQNNVPYSSSPNYNFASNNANVEVHAFDNVQNNLNNNLPGLDDVNAQGTIHNLL
jgi:hypothetical protein